MKLQSKAILPQSAKTANYPIIIGGSAGSFKIISRIIPLLPPVFPFPIIICVHRHRSVADSFIPALIREGSIPVIEAADNELILPGRVYVAPANKHLTFKKNHFILSSGPPVNYSRPSIDITLKSAAEQFGDKLIGILLTGANTDGTEGMKSLFNIGAITVVQNPEEAEIRIMPKAAVDSFNPTHILSADKIISFIKNLAVSS